MRHKTKKILISFPMAPAFAFIHKSVSQVLWRIANDTRYDVLPMWPVHAPFENNLNLIVKDFINYNCEFWLSIDYDNPPLRNPLDLVELGKDIIGLPTPIWHFKDDGKAGERPIYWSAYDYNLRKDAYTEHQQREGLQEVDAIGTGCFLIKRCVFENEYMRKGPFMRNWDKSGVVERGNDIRFCEKARAQGFKIYTHYDYPCDHYKTLSLNEIVRAFKNLYADRT
jgi:hypothetical protein